MTEEEKKMEAGLNKTSLTRALLINVIQLTFNQSRNTDAFIMYAPAVVFFFFFFSFACHNGRKAGRVCSRHPPLSEEPSSVLQGVGCDQEEEEEEGGEEEKGELFHLFIFWTAFPLKKIYQTNPKPSPPYSAL